MGAMRFPLIVPIFGCFLAFASLATAEEGPTWALGIEVPEEVGKDYELASGARFHLEVVDNQFYAVFIDENRFAVEPEAREIILRGEEARNTTNDFNLVLSKQGATPFLTHPRHVYPPYDFWITVVVPHDEAETEVLPRERFLQ